MLRAFIFFLYIGFFRLTSVECFSDNDLLNAITFNDSAKTDTEYYEAGIFELSTKSYRDSLDEFRNLRANYPFSKYSESSFLIEPFLLYLMNDFDKMEVSVNNFLARYPNNKNKPYILYMKAVAISELAFKHDKDKSLSADGIKFSEYVIENYRNTMYAQKSKDILIKLQQLLYDQELEIADFYYNESDFISAASRYFYILNDLKFLTDSQKDYLKLKLSEVKNQIINI